MTRELRYRVSLAERVRHLVDVTLDLDAPAGLLRLRMATWTPGSYLIREYARNVLGVRSAQSGTDLPLGKVDKATWSLDVPAAGPVQVAWQVYAHELTVRTSHVDDTHAALVPASIFLVPAGREGDPIHLTVDAPPGWEVATALTRSDGAYRADGFARLIDCPLEIGPHRIEHFVVGTIPHELVIWGAPNAAPEALAADAARVAAAASELLGPPPFARYLFILLLAGAGAGGGLEHADSTSLLLPRHVFAGEGLERWWSLVAHEYVHAWIGKRLRPAGLADADLHNEAYTRLLWLFEGGVEYLADLVPRRAGLLSVDRFLARLGADMSSLAATPGRHAQSLEQASFDAWIRFYRPDEASPNLSVSYYLAGALTCCALDLTMRRAGGSGFDALLCALLQRFGDSPVPEDGAVADVASELSGTDLRPWFAAHVAGTEELEWEAGLGYAGVEVEWARAGDAPELGVQTRQEGGGVGVTAARADGPAAAAGVSPGDEILAVGGFRVTDPAALTARLGLFAPGDTVEVLVSRREQMCAIPVVLGAPRREKATLRLVADPSPDQLAAKAAWLGEG